MGKIVSELLAPALAEDKQLAPVAFDCVRARWASASTSMTKSHFTPF